MTNSDALLCRYCRLSCALSDMLIEDAGVAHHHCALDATIRERVRKNIKATNRGRS